MTVAPAADHAAAPAWHSSSVADVADALETDPRTGLDRTVAAERLRLHGPNVLAPPERWARLRILIDQFNDVLVWLLIAAAATSGVLLGAWIDATAIGAIVVLNAAIGYAQESRAHAALARLSAMEAPAAKTVRNGTVVEVRSREVVPGDVIALEAGDRIPADGRIASAIRMVVDEAPLTGESIPVSKDAEACPEDTVLVERSSMLYAGTTVVAGRGQLLVVATGRQTEMGKIAELFEGHPSTPLEEDLTRIGRRLATMAAVTALLVLVVGLVRSFPVETMVLTAVALAVAAIPEGLPTVITISLAGGLQRMAHRNAVVRRLAAVEALGAVDVICTDKTGTLTVPELEVGKVVMADGRSGPDLFDRDDIAVRLLVSTSILCNDSYLGEDGWKGDPTEVALVKAAERRGIDVTGMRDAFPRLDEAGFDGRRKRMSTVHSIDGDLFLLVKGAPEVLIARSGESAAGDDLSIIDDAARESVVRLADAMASQGVRTLGFAAKPLTRLPTDPADEEHDLIYLGMAGLAERIRPEVPQAVASAASAGVRTVIVTGDHATTGRAVADKIGLTQGKTLTGRELSRLTAGELAADISEYRVFARVDPTDKVKIVEAWQRSGARVAMTGDGVNDAPALNRADIGVAMGSGTDVARDASAIVLTDDNYATIVVAIAEGRRLFANLRNVVHYLLSANAAEVLYVLAGFLFFGHLGEPLLAVQILWINLVTDAMPAVALGMDQPLTDPMRHPPGSGRDVLGRKNLTLLVIQGVILAGGALAALVLGTTLLAQDHAGTQTMVFTTLVIAQLLHALSIRANSVPRGEKVGRPGKLMVWSLVGSVVLHLAIVYSPVGDNFFRTVRLEPTALLVATACAVASMVAIRVLGRFTTMPALEVAES
jgi:P-type Ca2+ transporter type 2C